jgi:predicted GIY-YIG superfamily endonuclease
MFNSMPDYSKLVIYKIQHEEDPTLLYVGSTCNFTRRKCQHKLGCNDPKLENRKLYKMVRQNGNWESFKMTQIKEFPCNNKREAEAEENEVMLDFKASMNDHRSSRTREQYRLDNYDKISEYHKTYYLENAYKFNKKITCECGSSVVCCTLTRHKKSKKHIDFMSNSQNQ